MTADQELLAALPGLAFGFALVLCRVSAAIMLLPGLGEAELPMVLRAGIALALTLLLLPVLLPLLPAAPDDPARVLAMVAAELATGLWLGWLARLIVLALPMAGSILATMIGLSSVLQPDPALGGQSTALARLLGLAAPVLVLISGLYAWPLMALAGSFTLIPPGAVLPAADGAEAVLRAVGDSFALALRLAAPFILAGTLWQVAAGLAARLVPRLQVYFVVLPGQILGGLLLLGLLAATLLGAWQQAAHDGFAQLPGLG